MREKSDALGTTVTHCKSSKIHMNEKFNTRELHKTEKNQESQLRVQLQIEELMMTSPEESFPET